MSLDKIAYMERTVFTREGSVKRHAKPVLKLSEETA
jgi:hypothetical protein